MIIASTRVLSRRTSGTLSSSGIFATGMQCLQSFRSSLGAKTLIDGTKNGAASARHLTSLRRGFSLGSISPLSPSLLSLSSLASTSGRDISAARQINASLSSYSLSPDGSRAPATAAKATAARSISPETGSAPLEIDWDNLGFGLRQTDYMFSMKCELGQEWEKGLIIPFGNLELSPSAAVLNYAQGVFEGLKAYNTTDGRILIFRPYSNAQRMQQSASRMSMPFPSEEQFVNGVLETVRANKRWIPPPGKGSLYIRPLLIGSGAVLGLQPSTEYTFLVYVSPVGNYFKGGTLTPIALKVEELYHRAAPGGTGDAKTIGNYSPVLKTQLAAKKEGFADVLYLDAVENRYIEEVSSCNIFIVKDGVISTPSLRGTILPGITRRSIIELSREMGYEAVERNVEVSELMDADEVFCTGTAVVISPVGSVTYKGEIATFNGGKTGGVSQRLYTALTDMQMGRSEDTMGWTMEVTP